MPRPIALTIDIDALRHNLSVIRKAAGGARIWAVAKADAYGHGISNVVGGFSQADGLAVLDLEEARIARASGWMKPILMIEGAFSDQDLNEMHRMDLTTVITSTQQADMFLSAAVVPGRAWIKLNTGMNRLGIPSQQAIEPLARMIAAINGRLIQPAGLMMHFACADSSDGWQHQYKEFQRTVAALSERLALPSLEISMANSAAAMGLPQTHGHWIRPGIALYGASPLGQDNPRSAASLGLMPAQRLTSQLIAIQQIQAGDSVGYGARFRAARPSRIGVVAAGYADGYPRAAPDGTPVWVAGRTVPIAGRVSMDLITVDLTDHPDADVGAEVELWGGHVPIDAVAGLVNTIGYELMCKVTARVPRRVVDGQG